MSRTIQRSFASGEIAPSLRARADLSKYSSGLALCKNFFVRSTGGLYSRAGLRFVGEVDDSTKRARLIPFSFNTEQTYILVFEHLKMQVIKDGGYIESSPGVRYSAVHTYTEAELPRLAFTQDADIMTIVHPSHDPAKLSRVSETNWTFTNVSFAPTISPPVLTTIGTVGVASTLPKKTYSYVVTVVNANGEESLVSNEVTSNVDELTSTYAHKINWNAVGGAEYYRVYKDPGNGSTVYGWIGDTNSLYLEDYNVPPDMSDGPPEARTPFSGVDDKPAAVGYYQQRQVYANTTNEPQTVFTSQTGLYDSMRRSVPARADDAITFIVKANQVNEVRHILSLNSMIMLTSDAEWLMTEGQDQVLTPFTAGVRAQSFNGAAWVTPVTINNTALFVQASGTKIRDLRQSSDRGGYDSSDLSIMSTHLFEDYAIDEMSFAKEPYGILWCVRNDGILLGLTYQREHEVWGWHQHETDGVFESVATIAEGTRDATYVVVNRTINGSTVRYVERFEARITTAAEDAFCVDSGLSYDGTNTSATTMTVTTAGGYTPDDDLTITASTSEFVAGDVDDAIEFLLGGVKYRLTITAYGSGTSVTARTNITLPAGLQATPTAVWSFARVDVSGLTHLEGEPVDVLADGNVVEGLSVASGVITIPRASTKIHVGLAYTPTMETLDLDVASLTETMKGRDITINELTVEFEDSRGGWVGVKDDLGNVGDMYEFKPRFDSDGYDPIALKSFKQRVELPNGWYKAGGIRLEQRVPLPMEVLAVIPKVEVGD